MALVARQKMLRASLEEGHEVQGNLLENGAKDGISGMAFTMEGVYFCSIVREFTFRCCASLP